MMKQRWAVGIVLGVAIAFSLGMPIGVDSGQILLAVLAGLAAGPVLAFLVMRNGEADKYISAAKRPLVRTEEGEPVMYPECPHCGQKTGALARCRHCNELILPY